MQIKDIANTIKRIEPRHAPPVLIGIEGFGGSGKTTLSTQLGNALGNAYIIRIDDFLVKSKLRESAWDTGVFDHARLEKQVLKPATQGKAIIYKKLLYATNRLSDPIQVPKVDYVIIEGISCYIPTLRDYYDFKVWVDTPIQVAKKRGQARDGTHGSAEDWDAWAKIDLAYQQKYHPELLADFIVSNN